MAVWPRWREANAADRRFLETTLLAGEVFALKRLESNLQQCGHPMTWAVLGDTGLQVKKAVLDQLLGGLRVPERVFPDLVRACRADQPGTQLGLPAALEAALLKRLKPNWGRSDRPAAAKPSDRAGTPIAVWLKEQSSGERKPCIPSKPRPGYVKAEERVQAVFAAAGWDGRWNRDLFRRIADELNLPLPTVERHAEGLQSRFRTAAATAAPQPEERTRRTTMPPLKEDHNPSPPAYPKPDRLSELQSEVWDEFQKQGLPIDQRLQWKQADAMAKRLMCAATSIWGAQETICKKLEIDLQKNPNRNASAPHSDTAAASAEPEKKFEAESPATAPSTEDASSVDLQASLQAILSRADLDAEIERGGLFGALEALVQRDRATRQELSVYQDVLVEQKLARERLETTLAVFRNSIAEAVTTPARSLRGASDNDLITAVRNLQSSLVDLQDRYQQALADREQLLGEVARAHEELDVADISRNALQSDPPQGEPDQLTLAQRINELVAREEKVVEGASQALQPTEPNLSTLVIRSLVTLSDRDSVHRAADLLERTVLQ